MVEMVVKISVLFLWEGNENTKSFMQRLVLIHDWWLIVYNFKGIFSSLYHIVQQQSARHMLSYKLWKYFSFDWNDKQTFFSGDKNYHNLLHELYIFFYISKLFKKTKTWKNFVVCVFLLTKFIKMLKKFLFRITEMV